LSLLTSENETVFGVWNTTAGGNSILATEGDGTNIGEYYTSEIPTNVFDQKNGTKYTAFGACTVQDPNLQCGINTGLYLTLQRGASLLVAFRIITAPSLSSRDPLTVTMEGSVQNSSRLIYGSSWTLIYNGSSGLNPDPGRSASGITQTLSNNFIWPFNSMNYNYLVTNLLFFIYMKSLKKIYRLNK
jgi:hypothetical protein